MDEEKGPVQRFIESLEALTAEASTSSFEIAPNTPPRRATFRILTDTYASIVDRKIHHGEVLSLSGSEILFRSPSDVARGRTVEMTILESKSHRGEALQIGNVFIKVAKKVSGAYLFEGQVTKLRRREIPVHRRFLAFLAENDREGWNRWCFDFEEGPSLIELDLSRANLAGWNLCCADLRGSSLRGADLSGANLAGADLTRCDLEGAKVAGADFFRCRFPRCYMNLLLASGLVEVESILLVE